MVSNLAKSISKPITALISTIIKISVSCKPFIFTNIHLSLRLVSEISRHIIPQIYRNIHHQYSIFVKCHFQGNIPHKYFSVSKLSGYAITKSVFFNLGLTFISNWSIIQITLIKKCVNL